MKKVTTLGQFNIEKQADFRTPKGNCAGVKYMLIASKIVNRQVNLLSNHK